MITPHPEAHCQKCGGKNPTWYAPNRLWNKVTGNPAGLIICPKCFQYMADALGLEIVFTVESRRQTELLIDLIDRYWKFDEYQRPISSWHDKQELLDRLHLECPQQ